MSYRRGSGSHLDIKALYDEFSAFITDEFARDPDYPEIKVCSFDDMPEMGMDHLILYVHHVDGGGSSLIQRIERFRPGTTAAFEVGRINKSVYLQVKVPLNDGQRRARDRDRGAPVQASGGIQCPTPMELVKWNSLMVGLLVVAWQSTEWQDWRQFARMFGIAL